MAKARRGRGEDGVYQRASDGRWVGSISLGYKPNGKRNRVTCYGRTKREVLDKLADARAKAGTGAVPDAGRLTVGQYLDRWLATHAGKAGGRTVEERTRVVKNHLKPRLGAVRLAKLTPLHVEGLYADLAAAGVGKGVSRTAADLLSIALNAAVRLKLIPFSPAAGVKKPAVPKRDMTILDADQARAVRAAAVSAPCGPLVATALGSGCRSGELLALGWADLDLRAATLAVRKALTKTKQGFALKEPKTASGRRTVTLPPFAVESLTAHKAAAMRNGLLDAPVFCTRTGGYLDAKNVLRAFRAVVKKVNKSAGDGTGLKPIPAKVRFHDLRHTVASVLLSTGHSLRAVSQRLGHRDPAFTLRVYAHVLPTDDAKLADGLAAALG